MLCEREDWKKWEGKRLIRLGYWPQYRRWQKDWVNFDEKKIVNDLVKGKIGVLDWSVPENWTYVDTMFTKRHPALRELKYDALERLIIECKKHNIKFMLGVAIDEILDYNVAFFTRHRELLKKQGVVFQKDGLPEIYTPLCFNMPLVKEVVMRHLIEIAKRYDIDGFIFDTAGKHNPLSEDGRITCDFCREKYEKEKGKPFPGKIKEDWDDPVWKEFIMWINKERLNWLEYIHSEIKRFDNRLYVIIKHVGGKFDSIYQETTLNDTQNLLNTTIAIKMKMVSMCWKRAGGVLKTSELANDGFAYAGPSYIDALTQASIILANGGWIEFHSTMDDRGIPHEERTKVYIEVGKSIAKKIDYLIDAEPIPQVAILNSRYTNIWYEHVKNIDWYFSPPASFAGCEQSLIESHVPTGYIADTHLTEENLKRYKVLFLPNIACMSDGCILAVKEFVKRGGGLIATHETSLYNESGIRRKNFGLGDVFGIRLSGVNRFAREYIKGKFGKRHPYLLHNSNVTKGLEKMEIAELPWFDIKFDEKCRVIGTWTEIKRGTIQDCVNKGQEVIGDSKKPCIVTGRYGKGKVVYVSFDITASYFFRNVSLTRELIKRMVNWVSDVPVYIEAPKSVEFTVLKQRKEKRIIANLINYAIFNKIAGNRLRDKERDGIETMGMTKDIAMRFRNERFDNMIRSVCDEYIPIYNIPLYVSKKDYRIKSVYTVPEKQRLKINKDNENYYKIIIPKVDIHTMVVINYEGEKSVQD